MQPKVNILFIEDERNILTFVRKLLYGHNYKVTTAITGTEGLQLINSICPDLILLDLGLPDMDGQTIIRQVREWSDCPIIVISARTNEHEKVKALDLGADDYITKPFSPIVLSARVRAIEKRCHQRSEGVYQAGELSVNEIRREVCVAGQTVDLTPKEYELLIYFKNNQNIAVSRENILNAVWGYDYFGDLRTVDTHVKKLRAKLGDCGKMIETVRGFGYRFEGEQQ